MRVLLAVALAACVTTSAAAQGMPESYRAVQLRMLETQRSMLLAMADSMPERLYRDKVTPIQRDFAQQIHHCASALVFIASRYFGVEMPALPDTATTFNSRDGLRSYVNGAYDFAADILEQQTASDRAAVVSFFGQMEIPKWQVWDEVHQHTIWTAGQVVANFRKHGMAPPGFLFF
jgi:hypothetical protein